MEPYAFDDENENHGGGLDDEPMNTQFNGMDLNGGDSGTGWNAEDMLLTNEAKYGYKSTYNSDLVEYTLQVEREDTEDYRRREEEAEKLALEIESSTSYKKNIDKELSDNEEEEEAFSAVVRTNETTNDNNNNQSSTSNNNNNNNNQGSNKDSYHNRNDKYSSKNNNNNNRRSFNKQQQMLGRNSSGGNNSNMGSNSSLNNANNNNNNNNQQMYNNNQNRRSGGGGGNFNQQPQKQGMDRQSNNSNMNFSNRSMLIDLLTVELLIRFYI